MIKRGDIFFADLPAQKNIQSGIRPVVIISNNKGNEYSPTVIISPLTTQIKKINLPTHITVKKDEENGLQFDSMVLLEQINTINKDKLMEKIGALNNYDMQNINSGIKISLDILEV